MDNAEFKMGQVFDPDAKVGIDGESVVSFKIHPPNSGELVVMSGAPLKVGKKYVLDDLSIRYKIEIKTADRRKIVDADPPVSSDWQTEYLFEIVE